MGAIGRPISGRACATGFASVGGVGVKRQFTPAKPVAHGLSKLVLNERNANGKATCRRGPEFAASERRNCNALQLFFVRLSTIGSARFDWPAGLRAPRRAGRYCPARRAGRFAHAQSRRGRRRFAWPRPASRWPRLRAGRWAAPRKCCSRRKNIHRLEQIRRVRAMPE